MASEQYIFLRVNGDKMFNEYETGLIRDHEMKRLKEATLMKGMLKWAP